jgi:hypothetical protein
MANYINLSALVIHNKIIFCISNYLMINTI